MIIDSFLWCTGCSQFRSGNNLSCHRKTCVTAADKGNVASQGPAVEGQLVAQVSASQLGTPGLFATAA